MQGSIVDVSETEAETEKIFMPGLRPNLGQETHIIQITENEIIIPSFGRSLNPLIGFCIQHLEQACCCY